MALRATSSEPTTVFASPLSATASLGRQLRQGGTGTAAVTRAEALTGLIASVLSTAAVLSDVSRARAEGNADGLGVVDDLLADCPSVSSFDTIVIL